jgi:hypothetical protein
MHRSKRTDSNRSLPFQEPFALPEQAQWRISLQVSNSEGRLLKQATVAG